MSGPEKTDPVSAALALRAEAIAAPRGTRARAAAWQRFMDAVFALAPAQQNEFALRVIASLAQHQAPRATAEAMDTHFSGPANDNARPL